MIHRPPLLEEPFAQTLSGKNQLSLLQAAALRNIISGAVRTQHRKNKAHASCPALCPSCTETVHLFWECPRWAHQRAPVLTKYHASVQDMPPCFMECGLFPQQLPDDHVFSIYDAADLTIKVQDMMISILQERSSLEWRPAFKPKAERPASEPVLIADTATQKSPLTKEELFSKLPMEL